MYIRFAVLSDPLKSGAPYFSFSLTLIRDFLGENAEEETPSSSERGKHSDNSLSDADHTILLGCWLSFYTEQKLFRLEVRNRSI